MHAASCSKTCPTAPSSCGAPSRRTFTPRPPGSADTLDRPDCYDPEIVYFADNLAQYGEALEFSLRDPASGVAFSTRFNSRDFPCATRWILNNPDQQVAAFVLPATARPEGYRAAAAAGTLQWLKAGEHKHFHVNTGIQE